MKLILLFFLQFYSTNSISYEYRSFKDGEKWIFSSNEVDVFYKNWEAGITFSIFEPGKSSLFQRRIEITKEFIRYEGDYLSLTGGSFYTNLGRGILLNASCDETILLDRYINGLLLEFQKQSIGFKTFLGVPKNYLYYELKDSTDFTAGGDFSFLLTNFFEMNASLLYLRRKDLFGNMKDTYMTGLGMKFSLRNIELYSELCGRKGWDPHFYKDTSGFAVFSGLNYSKEGFSLRIEGKDYKRFGHPYSLPPPLNYYGVYLNNARDETGYEIEGQLSPARNFYLTIDYAKTVSQDEGVLEEFFSSIKFLGEIMHVSLSYDNILFKNASSIGLPKRREITPLMEMTLALPEGFGIEGRYSRRKREELILSYFDNDFLFSISKFPYLDIAYAFEKRTGDLNEVWRRVEIYLHPSNNLDIEIVFGSRRSDLVCSGGICRYEPEFDGFLLKIIFRGS